MADLTPKTINSLPSAETHDGTELLALSQGGSAKKSLIADLVYPVGSIYMSVNATSPATLFGGTWQRIQDTFLLAAGSTYNAGDTGGEATHTLTISEMPNHDHWPTQFAEQGNHVFWPYAGNITGYALSGVEITNGGYYKTGSEGGGQAFNNMPPYLAVYVWKRTA